MNRLSLYPLAQALPPDEALRRLCRGARPFLLDGAAPADGLGRFTFGGCDPVTRHRDLAGDPPPLVPGPARPFVRLQQALASWGPLCAVGLLGYDLGRSVERLPARARPDDLHLPLIDVAGYDALYRHDAHTGEAAILATDDQAAARLRRVLAAPPPLLSPPGVGAARCETAAAEYQRRVARVRDHLRAGDCYQVNLCHRLRAALPGAGPDPALALYLRLRALAPAPLGVYLQLDGDGPAPGPVLLGNSPERLLRLWRLPDGTRRIETRPIKGTRPRGADPAADQAHAHALEQSDKDHAEHLMIVDLLRNDLGRVARLGSVAVEGFARRIELPTVHHLVSSVSAAPRQDAGLAEILTALWPGGSITGAPKVRAMEIIDELEPVRRGPFYGAVGWLNGDEGELALNIRTAVVRGGELVLAVGGGIVIDSTPAGEWHETLVKAQAFLRALG